MPSDTPQTTRGVPSLEPRELSADEERVLNHPLFRRNPPVMSMARDTCSEAYQAVGFLAHALGYWHMSADDPRQHQITKLLDNLSAAAEGRVPPHTDLLPFGWDVKL